MRRTLGLAVIMVVGLAESVTAQQVVSFTLTAAEYQVVQDAVVEENTIIAASNAAARAVVQAQNVAIAAGNLRAAEASREAGTSVQPPEPLVALPTPTALVVLDVRLVDMARTPFVVLSQQAEAQVMRDLEALWQNADAAKRREARDALR